MEENLSVEDVKAFYGADNNPLWKSVVDCIVYMDKSEIDLLLDSEVTAEERVYLAGRVSGIRYVLSELMRIKDECKQAMA